MANSARIDELRKKFDENPRRYFAPLANEYRKSGDLDQAIFILRGVPAPAAGAHERPHRLRADALRAGPGRRGKAGLRDSALARSRKPHRACATSVTSRGRRAISTRRARGTSECSKRIRATPKSSSCSVRSRPRPRRTPPSCRARRTRRRSRRPRPRWPRSTTRRFKSNIWSSRNRRARHRERRPTRWHRLRFRSARNPRQRWRRRRRPWNRRRCPRQKRPRRVTTRSR